MKQKTRKIIYSILIILSLSLFSISVYIVKEFNVGGFEQLIYTLKQSQGTSSAVIIEGFKYCLPIVLGCLIILLPVLFLRLKKDIYLNIKYKKKELEIKIPFISKGVYTFIVCTILILLSLHNMNFFIYFKNLYNTTSLFEDYYVDPKNTKVLFPEQKKNLLLIYLESMENGYEELIINDGTVNAIPNLTRIRNTYLNFSNKSSSSGGELPLYILQYTAASLASSSSGVPIKIPPILATNTYGQESDFLPGTKMLGEFLNEAGYSNYFLIGSDADFGGRRKMYESHGNYKILDYNWAVEKELIDSDYSVWWGYEDKKLFEYAKKILLEISKDNAPFNLTLLTADTHFTDGYLDESCDEDYSYAYANAIKCSDKIVNEFFNWIIKQDFYKDTVIILLGDHVTMQSDITDVLKYKEERTIFNAIINTETEAINTNNRLFSSLDMYPTILASLGASIEGNRLGLGTNLFSDRETLIEELGYKTLDEELQKNSVYYNEKILYYKR